MKFLHGLLCVFLLMLWHSLTHAQFLPNGSFENGLTGWNLTGTASSASLTAVALGNQIVPTDGSRVAVLSTGPGDLFSVDVDRDNNLVLDTDVNAISTTLNFDIFPAVLKYDYAFASSEQEEDAEFDDIFDVLLGSTFIQTGSSFKLNGGESPYPDVIEGAKPALTITGTGSSVDGTALTFGVPDLRPFCIQIADAVPGPNSINLQFTVADQGDGFVDSALIIDNVRVEENCNIDGGFFTSQLTNSALAYTEAKDGSLITRFAQNFSPVTSRRGNRVLFISSANYDGSNPSLLQQVYLIENAVITRLTSFTGDEVQSVDVSPDGGFAVVSAKATTLDNLEIYRIDLDTRVVNQITNTDQCDNTSPSISNNEQRLVFLSTCGDDFQAGFNTDGNEELIYYNGGSFIFNETASCTNYQPVIQKNRQANLVAFASDCNYSGQNSDGNIEVVLFNRNGSYRQITNTTGTAAVLDPVDINNDGRNVLYIAQDNLLNYVVYLYDDSDGSSIAISPSRVDRLPINAKITVGANDNNVFYESLDLLTFSNVISHVEVSTQQVTDGLFINGSSGIAATVSGGDPLVFFAASNDLLGGNSDGNNEIFVSRVE